MTIPFMLFNTYLFFSGFSNILFNKSSFINILISIEIFLLALNLNFILFGLIVDDIIGQLFSIYIITIAAAESAIGLAILIIFFRKYGSIKLFFSSLLTK